MDDWWCDQLRWSNQGVQKLILLLIISSSSGPSKLFMKHAYELLAPNDVPTVLIHCIGDEKCAVPMHMGMQQVIRKYIRTCPSVIQRLKYSCTMETAVNFYILEVSSLKHLPVKHPRNTKQAKNIRSSILGQQRLSHDVLYNLHELALDNPEFIHTIFILIQIWFAFQWTSVLCPGKPKPNPSPCFRDFRHTDYPSLISYSLGVDWLLLYNNSLNADECWTKISQVLEYSVSEFVPLSHIHPRKSSVPKHIRSLLLKKKYQE